MHARMLEWEFRGTTGDDPVAIRIFFAAQQRIRSDVHGTG